MHEVNSKRDKSGKNFVARQSAISILKKQHKEALLDMNFDPGDNLVVQMYLEQMDLHDLMKERYARKKKIFSYIKNIT